MMETSAISKRRYARIDCDYPGELEVVGAGGAADAVPVTVRALSLGGLGLAFDEWEGCDVTPGAEVTVRLTLGALTVELPGRVAWIHPRPTARFDLGVELRLDIAPGYAQRAYRSFVSRH